MNDITKHYSNGEVTIVWKPSVCVHSTICWKAATGLPKVFNPMIKPWIKPEEATTDQLIYQVKKCPSGALSYYMNAEEADIAHVEAGSLKEIVPNGPLLVYGNITISHKDGKEEKVNRVTAFCRCQGSSNMPYCDGSHQKNGFEG